MQLDPPQEETAPRHALQFVKAFGDNPSAFLSLSPDNRFFETAGVDGTIAYRPHGHYWIQFTGPLAAETDRPDLQVAFLDAAKRAKKRVVAIQLLRSDAEFLASLGWVANQLGSSYSVSLEDFTLRGRKFVSTRNKVSRSRRAGVTVSELQTDDPGAPQSAVELDSIDSRWLRDKGRHVKELRFMIGERGGPVGDQRRIFVASIGGEAVGYVSYSPVFGSRPGWLYDLTRRIPEAPPGVSEQIFVEAAAAFGEEGTRWVHLGLTPFVGLGDEHRIDGSASPFFDRTVGFLSDHGEWLYPAGRQLAFKTKWQPQLATPEYVAFPTTPRMRDIWAIARAANAL